MSMIKQNIIITSFQDIPLALIKLRISKGFSQEKLASLINMKQQQLQRYESNNYRNVGFDKIIQIANALGVTFKNNMNIEIN